jgi:hypothetical protein
MIIPSIAHLLIDYFYPFVEKLGFGDYLYYICLCDDQMVITLEFEFEVICV